MFGSSSAQPPGGEIQNKAVVGLWESGVLLGDSAGDTEKRESRRQGLERWQSPVRGRLVPMDSPKKDALPSKMDKAVGVQSILIPAVYKSLVYANNA